MFMFGCRCFGFSCHGLLSFKWEVLTDCWQESHWVCCLDQRTPEGFFRCRGGSLRLQLWVLSDGGVSG